MKFLTVLSLFIALNTFADSPRALKDVMKDMGTDFKAITVGLQAGKITPDMVTASTKLSALITEATAITPDSVLALPNIEQDAAKAKYVQEMKSLEEQSLKMTDALNANDLATAKQLLLVLGTDKKSGHNDFQTN